MGFSGCGIGGSGFEGSGGCWGLELGVFWICVSFRVLTIGVYKGFLPGPRLPLKPSLGRGGAGSLVDVCGLELQNPYSTLKVVTQSGLGGVLDGLGFGVASLPCPALRSGDVLPRRSVLSSGVPPAIDRVAESIACSHGGDAVVAWHQKAHCLVEGWHNFCPSAHAFRFAIDEHAPIRGGPVPWGLNQAQKGLWVIYHIGAMLGYVTQL